ncbi:hypothetical protein D0C36_20580 [Mucilaginibacter conchicola]|uniref:Uncharacterized protein n=1 Tax=Mucilaginibacter conchicola TaxID=2303333 RepID=A0A372NQW0_9SPHI|nr:hypothetical protein [Mucilaginibacter conchicola]RFZ91324.1 hypothetical protein D0C36_20580 [Mucilaginibacter conchicola]
MKTDFDLMISFRTPSGFKRCAQYFLGTDRKFAESVFQQLTGHEDHTGQAVLHLDLVESSSGLPLRLRTLCCKLSELSDNCALVTKELFRQQAIRDESHPIEKRGS